MKTKKKTKKALLVIESTSDAFQRFAEVLKNPSQSKHKDYVILSFPTYEALGRVITGSRLELLAAIRIHQPTSIRALAKIVKRDLKNVYQDVQLLVEYGLIELKETGARRAAHPVALYSEFLIAA